jgi:predicted metal-dependent hydrolase
VSGEIDVVRHPRARRMRLSVDPASGRTRLTLPPRAPLKAGMRWAAEQQAWIAAQRARLPQAVPFVPGARVPLRGRPVTIDWDEARPRRVQHDGDRLICGGPLDGLGRRIEAWLRREALRLLGEETEAMAARIGVAVERVAVGDARGRWGSCSSRGAIRYSWRLILAPDFVRRATVAHEVAHRVHMDHSRRFHALVADLLEDDPVPARDWLRANGAALHWIGRDR